MKLQYSAAVYLLQTKSIKNLTETFICPVSDICSHKRVVVFRELSWRICFWNWKTSARRNGTRLVLVVKCLQILSVYT